VGDAVDLSVNFSFLDQWYIYAPTGRNQKEGMVETTVKFELPEGFELSGGIQTPPHSYKGMYEIYIGEDVKWTQTVKTSTSLDPGEYTLNGKVRYQTCKEDLCLPPRTESIQTVVTVK